MYRSLLLLLLPCFAIAQYNPLDKPNTYRATDNPEYWQNKMPHAGYWQQDVHYVMDVELDPDSQTIAGTQKLTYWNNSPKDLDFVYLHLYQEAFQPGSYAQNLREANKVKTQYGKYEKQGLGTEIASVKQNGQPLQIEQTNTILKVWLNQPVKAGESITLETEFTTYFDNQGNVHRRMKQFNAFGNRHFDAVHWYPRICVYDRKFGWTTDQHMGKEFYGDFGAFDVSITLPAHYVLDATGNLLNRSEVLPDELRKKLDVKNFADKPWNSKPSIITPKDNSKKKTWKFHAENVHDFAFTCDPTYRIGETKITLDNGQKVSCIALVQEPHAAGWQNAADYTAEIIKAYSKEFGEYVYPKMIVADARDGMEYPMLTLDGGSDPGYRGLLCHEVGHNWFFGMIGNNETYRASLDEGFTQFATAQCLTCIDGDTIVENDPSNFYDRLFKRKRNAKFSSVMYRYLQDAMRFNDPTLNTHSDHFGSALGHGGGYRHVYYKTAAMLYNLQYTLGDELFEKAMQHYFDQWKIAHPYFDDFRSSIINYTGYDLNWFFDQWLEQVVQIDYKVARIISAKEDGKYYITMQRKGTAQMPIDFAAINTNGDTFHFHTPNQLWTKPTDATVTRPWIGWDKVNQEYTVTIQIEGKIDEVIIDPSERLADVNRLNNSNHLPIDLQFDHRKNNQPTWDAYEVKVRPELWYNSYDGLKAGVHFNGDYFDQKHKFTFTAWYNTGVGQSVDVTQPDEYDLLNYRFTYMNPLNKWMRKSRWELETKFLDGLLGNKASIHKTLRNDATTLSAEFKSMYRPDASSSNYLLRNEWASSAWNNTLNFDVNHKYRYERGRGDIKLGARGTGPFSDYNYQWLQLEVINENHLGPINWRTRVFGQLGSGTNWAPESKLIASGANLEEMMDNKYTRSAGFFPYDWAGTNDISTNHFQYGGGLNLRGYANYFAAYETEDGFIVSNRAGNTGASFNTEIEFPSLSYLIPRKAKRYVGIATYLFADAGVLNLDGQIEPLVFGSFRTDAGAGAALTIKKFLWLEEVKPLTIRFDAPLFLSRPPAAEEFVQFRWILAVERAF